MPMGMPMAMGRAMLMIAMTAMLFALAQAQCPHEDGSLVRWSTLGFSAAETVTIGAGQRVLFDLAASPLYAGVYIDGEVVFDDAMSSVELHAYHVTIRAGGTLRVGSECCPYENQALIELHGSRSSSDPDGVGSKVLGVLSGGTLELHGKVHGPTWTQLATTVAAGATSLTTTEATSWVAGDRLVLVTTDYTNEQYDEVTVTSVSGTTVNFTPALEWMHFAAVEHGVDMRGEVGLLNRNILIRGAADAGTADEFGAHVMILNGFSAARLEGVEVTAAGQAGVLGRYPVHYHLAGDASSKAYVRDCSLHHNLQRQLTLHGVHGLPVERNVMYDSFGHLLFLEDGVETGNYIAYNLIARARDRDDARALLPSDAQPACLWITRVLNTIIHNAAVGSSAHCYWFALPEHPLGPSYDADIWPRYELTGGAASPDDRFDNNRAHSCGSRCLQFDDGPNQDNTIDGYNYRPTVDGTPSGDDAIAHLSGHHLYRCGDRSIWFRGRNTFVHSSFFADATEGTTFATNGRPCGVLDSVYVGESTNMGQPAYEWTTVSSVDGRTLPKPWNPTAALAGYSWYDGPNFGENLRFYNFVSNAQREAGAFSMLREDRFTITPSNAVSKVEIDEISKEVYYPFRTHDGDLNNVFRDLDGTVTGRPPVGDDLAVITVANPFLWTAGCIDMPAWEAYICPDHFTQLRVGWSGVTTWFDTPYIAELVRDDKSAAPFQLCGSGEACPTGTTQASSVVATAINRRAYNVHFHMGAPSAITLTWQHQDLWWDQTQGEYQWMIVRVCMPAGTTVATMEYGYHATSVPAASLAALEAATYSMDWSTRGDGMWFMDSASGYLHVKLWPYSERTPEELTLGYPATHISATFDLPAGADASKPVCTRPDLPEAADERSVPPVATTTAPPPLAPPPAPVARGNANALCAGVCGNGVVEAGEACDGGLCCSGSCTLLSGVTCRAAAHPCDAPETCTGASASCPADGLLSAGAACDDSNACTSPDTCTAEGVCTGPEVCSECGNGVVEAGEACDGGPCCSGSCTLLASSVVCRPAAGPCDAPETCTGSTPLCPVDTDLPDGTACDDGLSCSSPDTCTAGVCSGPSVCACGNGVLDEGEACDDGNLLAGDCCSPECTFEPTTTVCRESSGPCDSVEYCEADGVCPADVSLSDCASLSCSDHGSCCAGHCVCDFGFAATDDQLDCATAVVPDIAWDGTNTATHAAFVRANEHASLRFVVRGDSAARSAASMLVAATATPDADASISLFLSTTEVPSETSNLASADQGGAGEPETVSYESADAAFYVTVKAHADTNVAFELTATDGQGQSPSSSDSGVLSGSTLIYGGIGVGVLLVIVVVVVVVVVLRRRSSGSAYDNAYFSSSTFVSPDAPSEIDVTKPAAIAAAAPAPAPPPPVKSKGIAHRALYDYVPANHDELNVTSGDLVWVLKAHDDGWSTCRLSNGKQGVLPATYLEQV